jgi:hypothetical protein
MYWQYTTAPAGPLLAVKAFRRERFDEDQG